MRTVEEWLADEPFRAPEADELTDLELGPRELAAAEKAGRLSRIAEGVVLGPDAFDRATEVLKTLPQPFTSARPAAGWAPAAASRCRCSSSLTRAASHGEPTTAREG